MTADLFNDLFTTDILKKLFPEDRADQFFDALYGDAADGAYDIHLEFKEYNQGQLLFELHLKQRPGKCLTCSLTYGLPAVFSRHPVINIKGMVQEIDQLLNGRARCVDWQFDATREVSGELHIIQLSISLQT